MRQLLPEWMPLVGLDLGNTNVVPVDWVAGALEHIAHQPDLDGRAFHLTDPRRQRVDELINELATAAHAPRVAVSIDKRLTDPLPKWPLPLRWRCRRGARCSSLALRELGIPEEVLAHMELVPRFDTREPAGRSPARRWRSRRRCTPTPRGCGTTGSARWTRASARGRTLQEALEGKHVMITGASSGIGRARALKVAAAGGIPLLVARNVEKLEEPRAEIVAGGRHRVRVRGRPVRHGLGRRARRAGARRPPQRGHARQQRRPLDPPLDRAQLRPLSRLRTHDAAQLLRRDQADHRPAAPHARARARATS